jgi:aspartyl-tRNA(Asn)/glutamyl-tRNA(Gln) amidotransferase subunit A
MPSPSSDEPPLNLARAAALVAAGRLLPTRLLEQCLARIERHEERLRAWAHVDWDGARETARTLEAELAAGEYRGPLHGVPLGVKDIIDAQGLPTRAGSPLTSPEPAATDAPVVARLRAAGAVVVGKTVTCEFACFDPSPTRNPWNLNRTPGGSSSGSAAAVAAGMCLGALASQTGGSITRPASYCGGAGCKATFGLVSTQGVAPVSQHLDHVGPIARTVADLAILLRAMADVPHAQSEFAPAERPPRLGVPETFFPRRAAPQIAAATRAALAKLERGGAALVAVALPESFDEVHRMHRRIMAYDAAEVHRARLRETPEGFGPNMRGLLEEGLALSQGEYEEALGHQQQFRTEILASLDGVDALITPAAVTVAPGLESTGDSAFNAPWSHAGAPTVSFPCGLAETGLPAALQLVGRPYGEWRLLEIAGWCEHRLNFREVPEL